MSYYGISAACGHNQRGKAEGAVQISPLSHISAFPLLNCQTCEHGAQKSRRKTLQVLDPPAHVLCIEALVQEEQRA